MIEDKTSATDDLIKKLLSNRYAKEIWNIAVEQSAVIANRNGADKAAAKIREMKK